MQLIFCDSCRRVVDPADLDGGLGARMGEKTYCNDCVPGGAGRPRDVASCRDCQVTVIHAVRTGGGELDHADHAICRRCTKNPARSPQSPHQVACAGCDRNVALQDLRIGIALPIDGQAWCRHCRTTSGDGVPGSAPTTITRTLSIPEADNAAPPIPPSPDPAPATPEAAAAAPQPASERTPAPEPNALQCDLCRRAIGAQEFRSGHAQAEAGKLVCGRCRGRSARRAAKKRQKWQVLASLAFLLVIFPAATAGLAIFIYQQVTESKRAPESADVADAPGERTATTERSGAVQPAPTADADQLMAELLAAVRKAAKEGAAQGAPAAAPRQPRATPEPAGRFQPKDAPPKGPGAKISARFASARVAREVERLKSDDPGVRLDAILELASLPADEAAPALLLALDDPDPFLRASAATAAGKCGHASLMQPLLNKLGDPEQRVRRAVARALSRIVKSESFYLFEDLSDEQLQNLRRAIERERARKG